MKKDYTPDAMFRKSRWEQEKLPCPDGLE